MTVNVNLSRVDIFFAQLQIYLRSRSIWIAVGLMSFALFLDVINKRGVKSNIVCDFCIVLGAMSVLITSIFYVGLIFFAIVLLFALANALYSGRKKCVLGVHVYTLTDEGLFERTNVSETFIKWSGISSISKTHKYLFVQVSSFAYYVIPKKSFADQSQYDQFWESIYSKWSNHGR